VEKKIIALAVAGLVSGAAFAQSNVTLYGAVHTGYVYSKSDYKKFQGVEDGTMGASRLGVKGEEALGNGLKAVFNLEWRVRGDTGSLAYRSAGSDARWAWVGLAGNFGTFTAGRVRTPSDDWHGDVSSMGWTGITPINTLAAPLSNGLLTGTRWDNSIKYLSPNFSGLSFQAVYSFGEKVNSSDNTGSGYSCAVVPTAPSLTDPNPDPANKVKCYEGADVTDAAKLGLGLRYANGPVSAILLYEAQADDDSKKAWGAKANTDNGAKGWQLGAAYDFKVAKVYATYLRVKANDDGLADGIANAGNDKQTLWSLGLSAPVSSAGKVWFEYAQYKDYLNFNVAGVGRSDYGVYNASAGDRAKSYNIGYEHTLSKRTSVHAYVTRFDNDKGINNAYGTTRVVGENQNVFAAGIRHNF
jgi:predicted porin